MSELNYRVIKSKRSTANANSYVGNSGELFYDPATIHLRISDGSTPGGTIINTGGAANDSTARLQAQGAFIQANSAFDEANLSFSLANVANTTAQAGFNKANTANVTAQAAFDEANSAYTLANTANTTAQFANYPQTNTFYVDAQRVDSYTPIGNITHPFKTIAGALAAAEAGAWSDVNPAFIVVGSSITENVTLTKGGIYLTGAPVTGGSGFASTCYITLTGSVTINGASTNINTNRFSVGHIKIVPGANISGVMFIGSNPQRLFTQDLWIACSGTGIPCVANSTGVGSTWKLSNGHLTGGSRILEVIAGSIYGSAIETAGNCSVANVYSGAVLTLDSCEIDANKGTAIDVYGTGRVTITRSILAQANANGHGITLNGVGSTAVLGEVSFNVPIGVGNYAISGISGSVVLYQFLSFLPGTNQKIKSTVANTALATTFVVTA